MGSTRPPAGRPPGRRGKAGVGPGPGYRPSSTGGGTQHKSSFATTPQIVVAVGLFLVAPLALIGYVAVFLAHGYGLL